jgi:hypothetical protein
LISSHWTGWQSLRLRWSLALLAPFAVRCVAAQAVSTPHPYTEPPHKQVTAVRVPPGEIRLDGRLDDPAWAGARWIDDFVEKMPVEGGTPTDSMRIALLYDDHALYVGARLYSHDPAHIQAPFSRRDNTAQAEHLWVSLDTYHDRRTAYSFGVTATGVRMDWYHARDNEYDIDVTFDPVWEAKAVIDSLGWTTEMRIPFSQLRFNRADPQVWGFNADHWIPARNEDVFWIPVPQNRTGWSSWMGDLVGIQGIAPSRRLELLPYTAGNATFTGNRNPANPFDDGRNLEARAGTDLKMGFGPNLTLDATVNPDFGQVEADPAVVNLSAFEVFFDEKRPFFLEGDQLLRGNGPSYYYSRRIGAQPRGDAAGDFVDYPGNSTILAAGKLTGQLASGLSVGTLAAVTGREFARTYDTIGAISGRTAVAPPTGYGVVRVQQQFGANASTIGATLTGVRRDEPGGSPLGALLDRQAVTGGVDGVLRWGGGVYQVRGYAGFSAVSGDSAALIAIQQGPAHFYQRPDAGYVRVDSSRTSLGGYTGGLEMSRNGGHWLYDIGFGIESPGLELNDAGRLFNADGNSGYVSVRYRETRPSRWYQSYGLGVSTNAEWDFGGIRQFAVAEQSAELTLKNYWQLSGYFDQSWPSLDHALTRGGPLMATPRSWEAGVRLGSSFGAKTAWNVRVSRSQDALGGESSALRGSLSIRPTSRVEISLAPSYSREIASRQYITTLDSGGPATYGQRYVFGVIDRSTLSAQLRLTYTLTPDLTLELYAEPFAASGRFYGIGELARGRTTDLAVYSLDTTRTPSLIRDPVGDYTLKDANGFRRSIDNPDFNVLSFRSNLVLRWEWRPGSTLFVVWQQNRFAADTRGALVGPGDLWDSFRAAGDNFLALKVSYWLAP